MSLTQSQAFIVPDDVYGVFSITCLISSEACFEVCFTLERPHALAAKKLPTRNAIRNEANGFFQAGTYLFGDCVR